MSRTLVIHRLATREYEAARRRYARQAGPTTELRFIVALREAYQSIVDAAESCAPFGRHCRWVKTKKFPFIVYFAILDDAHAIVLAVAHERRRPGYWLRRLHRP